MAFLGNYLQCQSYSLKIMMACLHSIINPDITHTHTHLIVITVGFSQASFTGMEGARAELQLVLSTSSQIEVTVDVVTRDGSATGMQKQQLEWLVHSVERLSSSWRVLYQRFYCSPYVTTIIQLPVIMLLLRPPPSPFLPKRPWLLSP